MDTNVLKEFLVKVGFTVDRAGLRSLHQGLVGVTGAVTGLVKAAAGMATAVTAAVTVTARQLDTLYYSSQRAESTAESLLAIGHAARSVGLTASGVRGQIEGMAASFRDMPPMRSWLQGLTGTQGGTPEQMMEGFARYYRTMMQQGREVYARMVLRAGGMDPETIRQIAVNLPTFMRSKEEAVAWFRALNFNADMAAKTSVNFMREVNRSWQLFGTIWDKIATTLLPILETGLRNLNQLVIDHMEDIRAFVDGPLKNMVTYLTDPKTWAGWKEDIDYVVKNLGYLSAEFDKNWPAIKKHITDTGIELGKLVDYFKWIADHPNLLGTVGGAVVGSRFGWQGALVGAVAGAALTPQSKTERGNVEAGIRMAPFEVQVFEALRTWLTERTKSPNVEIYEAQGLWSSMKNWLLGSAVTAPFVNLAEATIAKIKDAMAPGGTKGVNTGEGDKAADAGDGGSRRPGGRLGGMGPTTGAGGGPYQPGRGALSLGQMKQLALNAGFKGDDAAMMAAIWMGESSGRSNARGAAGEYGIAQIHPVHKGAERAVDPQVAASMSYDLYRGRIARGQNRFSDWSVYKNNWYKKYIDAARNATLPPQRDTTGDEEYRRQNPLGILGPPGGFKTSSFEPRGNPYGAQLASANTTNEGDRNITISPQTTINVHGDDPHTTARYVGAAQGRVTEGVTRAFQHAAA